MGGEMSGRRSTRSWLYENRPSTHSAAIIMVAKTGLSMDTRVNHMGRLPRRTKNRVPAASRHAQGLDQDLAAAADAAADALGAARCTTTLAGAPSFRLSKRAASTDGVGREALHHLDRRGARRGGR
jgi:hypothetical protein